MASLLGDRSSTVTFADIETKKKERRTGAGAGDKGLPLPVFHESEAGGLFCNIGLILGL